MPNQVTDEMYEEFKRIAFGPESANQSLRDTIKNGIEAVLEMMNKPAKYEVVGRIIEPGPAFGVRNKPPMSIRSYGEYSKESLAASSGYWKEGDLVYRKVK